MQNIGLFFGSFNPVHVGHLIIANHMLEHTSLDGIWMIVSPHNPFKNKKSLANDYDRLHLVRLATEANPRIEASDIEFGLDKPSYTVDTMAYLEEKFPKKNFSLIMGGDNLGSFHKWKNYETLLNRYTIYVYSRPNYDLGTLQDHEHVHIVEAPMMSISASYIRKQIREEKSIQYLVTEPVHQYINDSNLYK